MIQRTRMIGTVAYLGGVWGLPEAFCWSWGAMREFNREYLIRDGLDTIHYTRALFSLHASARNMLAEQMRGEWLFMTDTDHMFEPDVVFKLVNLMQEYHVPVLSGIYRHKALPHHPMLWIWNEEQGGLAPLGEYDPAVPLFRVDAAGAGCLLIHRSVFQRLQEVCPDEEPFEHRGKYGEDFSFFLRCRQAGIPVYATPQVETIHLVPKGITDQEYVPNWYVFEDVALPVPGVNWD